MNYQRTLSAALLVIFASGSLRSAEPLQIVVSDKGLQSLTYQGTEYCDPSGAGVLGFTGGHEYGNLWVPGVLDPQKGKTVFVTTPVSSAVKENTVTQTYPWGTLSVTYTPKGSDLYVTATLSNTSQAPIGWWKANLFQFNNRLVFENKPWQEVMPYGYTPNMHYDYRWAMWGTGSDGYETWNFTDPHVYWWVDQAAPFDKAPVKVMFADLDPKWQTGVYHLKTEKGDRWPVIGAADGDPGNTAPLRPGQADTARMVIRFRPATESALTVCADGYEAFGRKYHIDFSKDYDNALQAVQHGNLIMFNCWYASDESKKVKEIYQKTHAKHTPRAEDQKVSCAPDTALKITLHATDEDKDPVTYALMGPPEHGMLSEFDAKNGTVTYTPAKGFSGADSFTFKATDETLWSNRGTVGIVVK